MIPKERRLCTYDFQGDECPWNYKCDDDEDCDFLMFNVEVGEHFEIGAETITIKAVVDNFQIVYLSQYALQQPTYDIKSLKYFKALFRVGNLKEVE